MSFPLLVLAFGAIFVGYLGRDAFIGVGSEFFKHAIYVAPQHMNVLDAEFIPVLTK
jgi:NADH-ubiquinone oxidoreductase chain 5